MTKKSQRPDEDSTIAKAIILIDPKNTLIPGTREYDRICDLIRSWIDQCGNDYALCMAKKGALHLDQWRKFL